MGRTKLIQTPEEMWSLFEQYVEHERNNPMTKIDYVGKDGDRVDTPLQVPITFEGFECWLWDQGVIKGGLADYSSNKQDRYGEYAGIITRIKQNCFAQNFKGAAVGLFSHQLIARKLGLIDKTQAEVKADVKVEQTTITIFDSKEEKK